MFKTLALSSACLAACLSATPAHALSAGQMAFTAFNADEDGFAMVALTTIAANTTVYFGDNEWNGSVAGAGGAFNTGEAYLQWLSGGADIAAGTVLRFASIDKTTLSASVGALSRVAVSGSTNYGLANSNETLYAYQGSSATAPTNFIAAITNGSFTVDGTLAGTGLTEGVNAIRLNANVPTATPDFGEYTGARSGETSFAAYLPAVTNPAHWQVDTSNGSYASTVPNATAFSVTAVPEPDSWALALAGVGLCVLLGRRHTRRLS